MKDAPGGLRDRTDLEPLRLTDLGNAKRLVLDHGQDIRYVHEADRWLIFDGRRWPWDETGGIERRAKATIAGLYAEAAYADDRDHARKLAQHAVKSESARALAAMVRLAQSEPGIPITLDQLDADPWLFNVENGTLDLRTGTLRAHRREDLITKLVPIAWDAEAECPVFLGFLDRVMGCNARLIRFMQKFIGYSLTGDVSEQILVMFWGVGANGKTTLIVALNGVFGDYARSTPVETLLAGNGDSEARHELAKLRGARLVAAVESDSGRRLSEAFLKSLSGGDRVTARALYKESFEFTPTFKVVLSTNHRPIVRGTDHAIWRRIRLVPFTVTIPPEEQDRELPTKLRAELPGILRWAVEGCLAWQREGLTPPREVTVATEEYRKDMDVLGDFIASRCVVEPMAQATSSGLYSAYVEWCKAEEERPITNRSFGRALIERGAVSIRTKAWRGYQGIRLKGPDDADEPSWVTDDAS